MSVIIKRIRFNTSILIILIWASFASAESVEYEGLIQSNEVIDIGSPVEGIVANVAVERSGVIKKGDTLVNLESSVEQATLDKALAMAKFGGEIRLQETNLAFAERVHQRIKDLPGVSTHDKDKAATEIILSRQRLQKAKEEKKLAELEYKRVLALLTRCAVKSPISGVVVERFVSPGEHVNDQPLLRIAQIDPLRVDVILPSGMFGRIAPGMSAVITPELPEYGEQRAIVSIVDRIIDSASNTFGVRLELPNKDHMVPSGLKCTVKFEINKMAEGTKDSAISSFVSQR